MWHDGFGWLGFGGWLMMMMFWGAIIALVIWGITKVTKKDDSSEKTRPLDIAKERYAKGEISKEEFEQIKKTLS